MAIWGGITALGSTTVLLMLPVAFAFMIGSLRREFTVPAKHRQKRDLFVTAAFFALGFCAVFMLLSSASLTHADTINMYASVLRYIAAAVLALWGLKLMTTVRLTSSSFKAAHQEDWPLASMAAVLIGGFLVLGWSLYVGPVLADILAMLLSARTAQKGLVYMALYGLGMWVAVVTASMLLLPFMRFLGRREELYRVIEWACGILLILTAVAMVTNAISLFTFEALEAVPVLGTLG